MFARYLQVVAENAARAVDPLRKTFVYPRGLSVAPSCSAGKKVQVEVWDMDTFSAAKKLISQYTHRMKPFCLNFANSRSRAGGYLRGAKAQEEDLCRQSDLFKSLQCVRYPWPSEETIVFSEDIVVFRDTELNIRKHPFRVDVLSAAAPYRPETKIKQNSELEVFANDGDRKRMAEKMRSVLRVAIDNGQRVGVLGAWGCGAFGGPAYGNAILWSQVLNEPEFRFAFDRLVFAIPGGTNFEIFRKFIKPQ